MSQSTHTMQAQAEGRANLTFGHALAALKGGNARYVVRDGRNGKGQRVGLQRPDGGSVNTLPYLYLITVTGDRVPWLASQTDMLAEDWRVLL